MHIRALGAKITALRRRLSKQSAGCRSQLVLDNWTMTKWYSGYASKYSTINNKIYTE